MDKEVYIVTAYRWGEYTNHSYNLGVFQDLDKAKQVADSHTAYRGGKYECVVNKCILNEFDNEADYYAEEVYRSFE